jgi:hypothetical protein
MKIVLCVVILFLAGCASTGVVQTGSDTFFIGKKDGTPGLGVSLSNQAEVYREANDFCFLRSLSVETVSLDTTPARLAQLGSTELYFKCVSRAQTVDTLPAASHLGDRTLLQDKLPQEPFGDSVAIIIGIEKYRRVPAADYANRDAAVFYSYAHRLLGVTQENIRLLIDDKADVAEILRAFKAWLPTRVNKGKTDVYVFFSGHGLPAADGRSLYFLPHEVDKDLLDRTAVTQKEVVEALQRTNPKSVTMFIDSCYSGQSRTGETLLTSARPISIVAKETSSFPPNFTVISASAPDQISSSSPELRHGIFSYYLMRGMEGEADANKDGQITVAEMQTYLSEQVPRRAMSMNRTQQPQVVGNQSRVLVGR